MERMNPAQLRDRRFRQILDDMEDIERDLSRLRSQVTAYGARLVEFDPRSVSDDEQERTEARVGRMRLRADLQAAERELVKLERTRRLLNEGGWKGTVH